MKVKYIKIRADFKYAEKGRFYRVFLVKEDMPLGELGEFIVTIFGGTMEHYFLFRTKEKSYIPTSWVDYGWDKKTSEPFILKRIKDLGDSFTFIYDTGDGWDFSCKVYKKIIEKEFDDDEDEASGFVLEGKGMGIWEDNIGSLYAYLEGEIDKDYNKEDEERGIYKPWNFDIDKYSEFDNPIDIDELNELAMYFLPTAEEERY